LAAGGDVSGGATVAGGAGGLAFSVGWQLANNIREPVTMTTASGARDMVCFPSYGVGKCWSDLAAPSLGDCPINQ
jgi:hypothetical protein